MPSGNTRFAEAVLEAARTAQTMTEITQIVGCTRPTVTRVLRQYAPDRYQEYSQRREQKLKGQDDSKRALILRLVHSAPSLSAIAKLVKCRNDYVARVLRRFAPDEYERLTGDTEGGQKGRGPINHSGPLFAGSARDHVLSPNDEALARSLARLAEWQSPTTRVEEGPLRIVPPGRIASPRVDEAAA